MWRPPSPGGGHLASGVCSPLQLPQAEGLPHVTSTFCPLSQGQGGDGHDGQYHCSRLSSPSGLLSVQPADGTLTIHPDIQLPEQDHPDSQAHQRGTEHPGRSRIPVVSHPYGVVRGSSVFQLATRSRQQIQGGPVCHPAQYPSEKLCLPGPSGSRGERPVARLERIDFHLSVSSSHAPQQAPSPPVVVQRPGNPGCSFSRKGSLVPNPGRKVSGSGPSSTGSQSVPDHKQRKGIPSVSTGFAASRLDTMMAALKASGFSEDSVDVTRQAHRESTVRQYQTVWQYFLEYLASTGVQRSEVTVCNFLSFHAT